VNLADLVTSCGQPRGQGVGCKDAQPLMTQDRELLAININSRPNTECQPPKKMIMEPPFGPLSPDGARKSDSTPSGGFSSWQSAEARKCCRSRAYGRPPDAVLRGGERQRTVDSLQLALAVASYSARHPRI
jgi:hypothetical protein